MNFVLIPLATTAVNEPMDSSISWLMVFTFHFWDTYFCTFSDYGNSAVTWLKYCWYGVKRYPINQLCKLNSHKYFIFWKITVNNKQDHWLKYQIVILQKKRCAFYLIYCIASCINWIVAVCDIFSVTKNCWIIQNIRFDYWSFFAVWSNG